MVVVRSLVSPRAPHFRWAVLSFPLMLLLGHFIAGTSLVSIPSIGVTLAATAAVSVIILVLATYIARLRILQASLTRHLQEADELQRVSSRVASADTMQSAVGHVLGALRQQYSFSTCALLSASRDTQETSWRLAGAAGAGAEPIPWTHGGQTWLAAMSCGSGGVSIGATTPDLGHLLPSCGTSAFVPIRLPDSSRTSMLVMGFEEARRFEAEDMRWLDMFARGVALPLERIRLQEELARMAYTDPMTGLSNYRAFRRELHEECERATRYGQPLILLLLDVDRFKRVNDRYGHPAGDTVLRHVAQVMRDHVRAIDLPARYGGEEFAILCPHTEMEAALVLAERLRFAVQESHCALPTGETLTVTLSIGAAVFAAGATSETDVVAQADASLYQAKRSGRNRVAHALEPAAAVKKGAAG